MQKCDVETRYEHGHEYPCVNVKVWDAGLRDGFTAFKRANPELDEHFDVEWFEGWLENHYDTCESYWGFACENGLEQATTDAHEILGSHVKVYTAGRSGGWLIVEGLPPIESWDAIQLGRWAKFAKLARTLADDVPYQTVEMIYYNVFEPEQPELEETAAQTAAGLDNI